MLKEKVLKTIKEYNLIGNGDRLVLGVSGGPDSISLLNVLYDINNDKNINLNFNIIVAHVNHLIRKEAESDEKFVKEFCKKRNIEFFSKKIDVPNISKSQKIGTEEAGRNERYKFFYELLEKTNSNKIAIAHNKNDRAETIIMNLLRGSGISGLKGIEAKRGKIIRPLIECERYEIEDYCIQQNIEARIDKTNFVNDCTRNKIRNVVIPYIKEEFNPNIIETLDRLSSLVIEEDKYFEEKVQNTYQKILINKNENEISLDLKQFNKLEKVIKSRLILYTITCLCGSPKGIEKVHIEDIIKLCENNIGNKFLIPQKFLKILIKNHQIHFIKQ